MHEFGLKYGEEWECFFFFNDTAPTEIYTLSLHDALPIFYLGIDFEVVDVKFKPSELWRRLYPQIEDRKSTRLNSSHGYTSYGVFCLEKKWLLPTRRSRRGLRPPGLTSSTLPCRT